MDKLSAEELKTAETELIKTASLGDSWPTIGLGHLKSTGALPKLYKLLAQSNMNGKITIAHSIFQICRDGKMIEIVLEETPKITNWTDLIDILYMLPDFQDERVTSMLNRFRDHQDYLVAFNATRSLGLPTDEVVQKFRAQKTSVKTIVPMPPPTEPRLKWWQKFFTT